MKKILMLCLVVVLMPLLWLLISKSELHISINKPACNTSKVPSANEVGDGSYKLPDLATETAIKSVDFKLNNRHLPVLPIDAVRNRTHTNNSTRSGATQLDPIQFSPLQQQQLELAEKTLGHQRKQLVKNRKKLSQQQYQQQLMAIKTHHQQTLISIMGKPAYQRWQDRLNRKRHARLEHHDHNHNH